MSWLWDQPLKSWFFFYYFIFYFSGLSSMIMRKIFNHWGLEPVYLCFFALWSESSLGTAWWQVKLKQFRLVFRLCLLNYSASLIQYCWEITVSAKKQYQADIKTYGPRHAKTCLRVHADSEGPDQTAHPRSLIRAFIVRLQNHWIRSSDHRTK